MQWSSDSMIVSFTVNIKVVGVKATACATHHQNFLLHSFIVSN